MKRGKTITEAQQAFTFTRRSLFLGGAQVTVGAVLAGRMAYLSIFENQRYALLAESNRVNLTLMPPRRGWIVDRAGKPLALNRTAFRVDIIPDRLTDRDATLGRLQKLLSLTADDMQRINDDLKTAAGFQPVQVIENLDWDRFAAVTIRSNELPGVAPAQSYARYYPEAAGVGHLLGYVGAASAKDYEKTKDPLLITPGFKVGKAGIERVMEERLRGKPGARRTEVTARGKLVRELETREDVPGKALKLTIDAGLQAFVSRRLGPESGSAVVIDCRSGGILAMASMPSFDPNAFSDGISTNEWTMLREDERVPMLNKPLQGLYPPGSTVKPIAVLALLKEGIDPDETVFCGGGYRLGNRVFKCLGRHGSMNMRTAVMKSCNTYFYAMGNRIGYDKIAAAARDCGLGAEYDLPFESQRYGTVPDSAWKLRKYKQEWTRSDTLNATIGQGYLSVSPLQLAVAAARIASGRMLVPHLIPGQVGAAPPMPYPAEHLAVAREGMDMVVNDAGTAVRSRLPIEGIAMAGKTGTAQVRRITSGQRGQSGAWKYRDHGLFVCFAPVVNPLYAAAVVIDHGMGGARAAAPVAKDFMTYMFDPAKAMEALTTFEEGWGGDTKTRMAAERARWKASHAQPNPAEVATPAANAAVAEPEVPENTTEPIAAPPIVPPQAPAR